ncbi:MAG TPA: hypothetical protein VGZ29_05005 [Terriglobia bacterium]|nr:hypothetical protein [Terriglobia bacterium]
MGCQHLEDEYELYLLGGLTGPDRDTLELHLTTQCPACLEGVREAAESVYWLVESAEPVRPRPAVKSRLMARLVEPARNAERISAARKR